MKKTVLFQVTIIILIFLSSNVIAPHEPGHDDPFGGEQTRSPIGDNGALDSGNPASAGIAVTNNLGSGVNVAFTEVPEGAVYQDKVLTYEVGGEKREIDFSGFGSGDNIVVSGGSVIVNNHEITASKISKENGEIIADGAKVFIATGNAVARMSSVETFQAGPIVITNGVNVRYADGCVSADYADSLIEVDNVVTTASQISYCKKKIEVKNAESVWAGCVLMENVKDSKITAGTRVDIEAEF